MRTFSGITTINSPEAVSSDNIAPLQMFCEKNECSTNRIGMNIQPYRTEFRTIYK